MKLKVLILGYGEMGHAMEYLLAEKHDVSVWSRSGPISLDASAGKADIILYCLPAKAHVEVTQRIVSSLSPGSLCLSIAKGLDESGMTSAQVFDKLLGKQHRYGVLYGPMISEEILSGRLAFADAILVHAEDFQKIRALFQGTRFSCKQLFDMHGCSWSVVLKNVYAIMFGVADQLQLGNNMRGHLMVTALSELSDIVQSLGAESHTPYSYAGLGDLLTTATSEDSHHHELGRKLASGQLSDISGEGIHTLEMVDKYHLFDTTVYPLYTLVSNIVRSPETLDTHLAAYFRQLQQW